MSSRLRSLNSSKISFFAFQDIITSVSGILILITLILATELERPRLQPAQVTDPQLSRKLEETLRQQAEADLHNQQLQRLVVEAETAPTPEKLAADIARLREQLVEEKAKTARADAELAAGLSAIEARDKALGLTDIVLQIQRVIQETESIVSQNVNVRQKMAELEQRVVSVQSRLLKLREQNEKLWIIPDRSGTTKEPILATVSASGVKMERFDHPEQGKEFSKANASSQFKSYLDGIRPTDQYVVFLIKPSGIDLFERLVKLARNREFEVGFDAVEEAREIQFTTPPPVEEIPVPDASTTSTNVNSTQTNSPPAATSGKESVPKPPATTAPPPITKSWWQLFLEWIRIN